MFNFLERHFHIKERGSSLRTEIIGGITAFATMSYILIVQANMMIAAGMNGAGVMLMTALLSGLSTLIMGCYTNMPFALAPGMGANAILAYTLVAQGICTWQQGLGIVFISGTVFVLLSLFKIREKVVQVIPKVLKIGVGASVGAFLIRLSLANANMVSVSGSTYGLNLNFADKSVLLSWIGRAITLILYFFRIRIKGKTYHLRGALLVSIILITIIGICMGIVDLPSSIFTKNALSDIVGSVRGNGGFDVLEQAQGNVAYGNSD